jgi:histidyl-tRNA synthetase
MSLQPVRGTRDLLDDELRSHRHVIRTAETIATTYNYQPIETPIFEYTSVFQRTLGETSDIVGKEMYTFSDRSDESITLRPEGTAAVVRAIISQGLTQTLPQKRIYSGPMFRYERPQKGRYRQFYQLGVECIGMANPFYDVECIALADQILKSLDISEYKLHLNTLGDTDSRNKYRQALVSYFNQYLNELSDDSKTRLGKNPLRILDSKDEGDKKICVDAPKFRDYLGNEPKIFFEKVVEGLNALKIDYTIDPHLVRGLDYYCHTAFEFKTTTLGAQDSILAGGRYDGLMEQMGGPSVPGVGWAMGIDRIALMLPTKGIQEGLRIAVIPIGEELEVEALKLMQSLRQSDFTAELFINGNLGKRFKNADKAGCQIAIVFGNDEFAQKKVKIRNLQIDDNSSNKEAIVDSNQLFIYLSALTL